MARCTNVLPHLELYGYWADARGARPAPTRRDIDPAEIGGLLRHIALIERSEAGYRWRLMGTAISAAIGIDLTARNFGEQIGPANFVRALTASFDEVLASMQPVFEESVYATACGKTHAVSRLLLPLARDDRAPPMVLLSRIARTAGDDGLLVDLRGAAGLRLDTVRIGSLSALQRRATGWAEAHFPAPVPPPRVCRHIAGLWERSAVPRVITA